MEDMTLEEVLLYYSIGLIAVIHGGKLIELREEDADDD